MFQGVERERRVGTTVACNPRGRAASLAMMLAASSACGGPDDGQGPAPTGAPPVASSVNAPSVSAPRPSAAPLASVVVSPSAAAPGSSVAREPAPKLERRVFRQVLVGMLSRTATRLTWILSSNAVQTDLDLYCQTATTTGRGLRLTGAEQDDAIWGDAVRVSYFSSTPKAVSGAKEVEYVFASRPHPAAMPCLTPPEGIALRCKDESIDVHPAGATLGRSNDRSDDSASGVWTPATREHVRARLCTWSVAPARALWPTWSVALVAPTARSPGVEWAFENSDMVLQDGGYRWLPAVGF